MPKIAEAKIAGVAKNDLKTHLPKAFVEYLGIEPGDSLEYHAEPFDGSEPTPQVLVVRRKAGRAKK